MVEEHGGMQAGVLLENWLKEFCVLICRQQKETDTVLAWAFETPSPLPVTYFIQQDQTP